MKKVLITVAGLAAAIAGAVVWLQAATPTIGPATATPAYIVVNTPTTVVITAQITDTSLIASSVNLIKVDSTGKTLITLGVMRDDGANGDLRAGDKTFSLRLSLNEVAVGQIYYRVSAAFRSVLQRVQSPTVHVTVDPFPLPPDPGEAGKQTLVGIDSDADGVRDDVQRYIAHTHPTSLGERNALTQYAHSMALVLSDANDPARVPAAWNRLFVANRCIVQVFGQDEFENTRAVVRAKYLNTRERSHAYFMAGRYPPASSLDELEAPSSDDSSPCAF